MSSTWEFPSFVDRVNSYAGDFCVFGSVCETHEMIWRMIGSENALLKIAEDPLRTAKFIERLGDFLVGIVEGQIQAAAGKMKGLYNLGRHRLCSGDAVLSKILA